MDISTNGDRVVANEGNAIKLWDLNTTGFRDVPVLSPKSTFVFHKRSVSALSLFEDSFVAGADLGGEVSLVDIRKEQLVAKFKSVSLFTLLSSTAAYCSRNSTLLSIVGVFICSLNYFSSKTCIHFFCFFIYFFTLFESPYIPLYFTVISEHVHHISTHLQSITNPPPHQLVSEDSRTPLCTTPSEPALRSRAACLRGV